MVGRDSVPPADAWLDPRSGDGFAGIAGRKIGREDIA
jgi:hypothetical protein